MITPELLRQWGACTDGYKRFCELFPTGADLKPAMKALDEDGHKDWSYWLFDRCRSNNLYAEIIFRGYRNSGYWNSGDRNSGDRNSGDRNSGDWNSGYWNSGDRNSGDRNSGDRNSGYWNSGDRNSGDRNSGGRNSGDWNSGYWNSGYFNTTTPDEIIVFDKPCKRTVWNNAYKPDFLYFSLTFWVSDTKMTDKEKATDPHFHVRGGQLQTKDYKEAFKESWNEADPNDRERVHDLPNFDAGIFFKISGIDLR